MHGTVTPDAVEFIEVMMLEFASLASAVVYPEISKEIVTGS